MPAAERVDFPWYNSPYISTSPNHYAQWAELLYLAGRTFDMTSRRAIVRCHLGFRITATWSPRE